jgi:tetratricopeptide (TPR) repeat protein
MADWMVNSPESRPKEVFSGGKRTGAGVRIYMAFGFGFNKQRVLSAAEKFVQQGKLQNAIVEYEKVLKADPKDLTVANTVGDLYARLGQNDKAVACFKSVGDAYATQGFTVKAIAMYKKLTKVRSTLESVLRLAELYTQQGLFNDARAQYLHVAEEFLRSGELQQAVRIFQKTLEMDPENVPMRMRLAEVYIRLGKKTEAWQIFAAAADSLRARGHLGPAEEILQRMLTLDPGNSYALLLRGRNAFESGDIAGAIANLEKVADLDTHPDGLRALLQAYLQSGRLPEAATMAAKLFSVHNDTGAITGYADALAAAGRFDEMLQVYNQYADRLLATDSAKVQESLHSIIGHVRDSASALETLLDLLQKAGDNSHVTEVYELLAHAYVQSGDLEKARDYYLKLTQLEPENQLHARNYQQVIARLGGSSSASRLITAEEGAVLVDELEATAPFIDQRYPDDVALAVRAALTDAELFASYNMPAKALGPLLSALPKAPRDLRLNQRLAALHTRAGRFPEAAVCCRNLEQIYHDAGHPDEATRYSELASQYEARASVSSVEPKEAIAAPIEPDAAPPMTPIATPSAAAASAGSGLFWHSPAASSPVEPAQEPAEFQVNSAPSTAENEIDISEEWEGELSGQPTSALVREKEAVELTAEAEPAHTVAAAIDEAVEEIRFYLAHSMVEQARTALAKLGQLKPGAARLAAMREELEAAAAQAAPQASEEISIDEINAVPAERVEPPAARPKADVLDEFVADLESSLGEDFRPETTPHAAPAPHPAMAEYAKSAAEPEQAGALGEFVADLETSLGDSFLPQAPVPQTPAEPEPVSAESRVGRAASSAPAYSSTLSAALGVAPAMEPAAASPAFTYQPTRIRPLAAAAAGAVSKPDSDAGVDLADMFGELKHELEEGAGTAEEDPETHYSLGVAFREMGLLDEAISELQKVCQAVDHGHAFPQLMQTYTWLAQCFLDKGVPEAAIRWYEQALRLSDIDGDTRTALHYELASAYEAVGNKPAALNHFMEVYGSNIDYRDVAQRIKALKS